MILSRRLSTVKVNPPKLFPFETVTKHIKPSVKIIDTVEQAFGQLSKGKVEVPMPMHIGIHESKVAGPGDCHIKGGYVEETGTWTVKLANVSFYNNAKKGLPPMSGIFIVCDATNGFPLGIFQENRYLTDLRTGAAGAIAVKHFGSPKHKKVAYVGSGAIAASMARATHCIHKFSEVFVYGMDKVQATAWAKDMEKELGIPHTVCDTVEATIKHADVIFTQTPSSKAVLKTEWVPSHATIIASGSDQPTKNELPPDLMKKSKFVTDLTRQCAKVGELRTALEAKAMTEADVYAEIGDVVSGKKKGRTGDELIIVDLTGTGAQDAAIGQAAWEVLKDVKV